MKHLFLQKNVPYVLIIATSLIVYAIAIYQPTNFITSLFGILFIVFVSHALGIIFTWLNDTFYGNKIHIETKHQRILFLISVALTFFTAMIIFKWIGVYFMKLTQSYSPGISTSVVAIFIGFVTYVLFYVSVSKFYSKTMIRIDVLLDWINKGK